ncbi:MAG: DUF6056 family protein [Oscillospiraceae bacterium]|jgi:hypothetical protein|nr:DUF6056 family protein [Oscillospiraceae bacterium]
MTGNKGWKRVLAMYWPFAAALLLWIVLCYMAFLQGDDYRFANHGHNLNEILKEYHTYYYYGGARMGNLLAGLFLLTGMQSWRVITPFAVAGLSLIIFYYVRGTFCIVKQPDKNEVLAACLCAVFPGLLPITDRLFGEVFLWLDGSTNYLYPMLLALIGFVPFYNTLRGRKTPRKLFPVAAVCFVCAALLHEQITILLTAMCICSLLYFCHEKDRKQVPRFYWVLTAISVALLALMLTAPGAYFRMGQENKGHHNLLVGMAKNFLLYFAPIINIGWPWCIAIGLLAAFLLCKQKIKNSFRSLLLVCLCFGTALASLSQALGLPTLLRNATWSSRFARTAECLLTAFWLLYFVAVLAALLLCAHKEKGSRPSTLRFLPVLYVGAWASQTIPAVATVASGRARFPLFAFFVLMLFCALWNFQPNIRWKAPAQAALVLIGMLTLACAMRGASINAAAQHDMQTQITAVQHGQRNTILIDYNQYDWTYCNVTWNFRPSSDPKGYESAMRTYYHLPRSTRFAFTKATASRSIIFPYK